MIVIMYLDYEDEYFDSRLISRPSNELLLGRFNFYELQFHTLHFLCH